MTAAHAQQLISLGELLRTGCQDEELIKAAARRESSPAELLGEAARLGSLALEQPGPDGQELSSMLEQLEASKTAIIHVLLRARRDPEGLGYYLGPRSESFEKLVTAAALLTGEDRASLRARLAGGDS